VKQRYPSATSGTERAVNFDAWKSLKSELTHASGPFATAGCPGSSWRKASPVVRLRGPLSVVVRLDYAMPTNLTTMWW